MPQEAADGGLTHTEPESDCQPPAAKKSRVREQVTEIPVSQPADVRLVAADVNEELPGTSGSNAEDGQPDRPLRVYADGAGLARFLQDCFYRLQ